MFSISSHHVIVIVYAMGVLKIEYKMHELHQVGYINQLLLIGQTLVIKLVKKLERLLCIFNYAILETWFETARTPGEK